MALAHAPCEQHVGQSKTMDRFLSPQTHPLVPALQCVTETPDTLVAGVSSPLSAAHISTRRIDASGAAAAQWSDISQGPVDLFQFFRIGLPEELHETDEPFSGLKRLKLGPL